MTLAAPGSTGPSGLTRSTGSTTATGSPGPTGSAGLTSAGSGAATLPYRNRAEAGEHLAPLLEGLRGAANTIVLALPRGGVPVAAPLARELGLPLDILLVRKLGMPGHPEYAIGAIGSGGMRVMSESAPATSVSPEQIEAVLHRETQELVRREAQYRAGRAPRSLRGWEVVLVDDGLATGASMRVAVAASRAQGADRVVVAVPVGSAQACADLMSVRIPVEQRADEVVCANTPSPFGAVGAWYQDFEQVGDEEVIRILEQHRHA
ncbi:Predicted phosphoribosyltransferase [Burkholderiales bacterium 8X]|nr:Predicted phosphoribosyltransferase [Burkholderiales bacterium 8X]